MATPVLVFQRFAVGLIEPAALLLDMLLVERIHRGFDGEAGSAFVDT
jgi:hypothetical protein